MRYPSIPPEASAVRSNLMAGLGVGMLLVLVFGVTFIAQYTGGPEPEQAKAEQAAGIVGVPLLFAKNEMGYDPVSEDLDKKYFQGFFEVTDQLHKVNFWFKNPHPVPVNFTVRGRSCTACTSANVAIVAPEAMRQFESQTATARLGVGVVPVPDLVTPMAHLALIDSLKWQSMDFETPDVGVTIPAAPDANTPTWGVFQVVVKVTGIGSKRLAAEVGMTVGNAATVRQVFGVTMVGASVFDVTPRKIDLGEFPEGAAPRVAELIYWSATRTQSELPTPSVNVNVKDAFLRVGAPVPLSRGEMEHLSAQKLGGPSRVTGGYRIPVTVLRKLPPAEVVAGGPTQLDVGPYDRQIGITSPGSASVAVAVVANVTGILSLRDGGVIDLKDFNGRSGVERNVVVVSDRADLVLELLPEECHPKFVAVTLGEPKEVGGRREWSVKLVVPPDACQEDLPPDSAVVLRAKSGGETVKVKLSMKGRGFVRGR